LGFKNIKHVGINIMENQNTKWHIIGIGGRGMSVVARLLKTKFTSVSGSDLRSSPLITALKNESIDVHIGHAIEHVYQKDAIIISTAIKEDNMELQYARQHDIPIFHRSEILNAMVENHQNIIGVMGTHGKGTVSGAIATLVANANYAIGGILKNTETNTRFEIDSKSDTMVIEIDESDGSFVNIQVNHLLVNNLSYDHMDHYGTLENLITSIQMYITSNKQLKKIYLNLSDYGTECLYHQLQKLHMTCDIITYGQSECHYTYTILKYNDIFAPKTSFRVNDISFDTCLIGEFNVSNLTGALAVFCELGHTLEIGVQGVNRYTGLKDRCDITYGLNKIAYMKVCAQHPEEIKLVSDAIHCDSTIRKVLFYEPYGSDVFQSFVKEDMVSCFNNADEIIFFDRENKKQSLFDSIENPNKQSFTTYRAIKQYLSNKYTEKTCFVFFGHGNPYKKDLRDLADAMYYDRKHLLDLFNDEQIYGPTDFYVDDIIDHSAYVTHNSIFFCRNKEYYPEALARGAVCIVSEDPPQTDKCTWIVCKNIYKSMATVAYKFYGPYTTELIGITGTKGKTTTCMLLTDTLNSLGHDTIYIGTLGVMYKNDTFETGMTTPNPFTLHKILNKYSTAKYCVMEVSSHGLELYRVYGLPFKAVALLNITSDHLDFHKTHANYVQAKLKLFDLPSQLYLINSAYAHYLSFKAITFGTTGDYCTSAIEENLSGIKFNITKENEVFSIEAPYIGAFNAENIACAFAILTELGYKNTTLNYPYVPGRMEIITRKPLIIVDFAHTEDSLKNVLIACQKMKPGRVFLIFGCAGGRDKTKRKPMYDLANKYANKYIITSNFPRNEDPLEIWRDIIKPTDTYIIDRFEAIKAAYATLPEDWLLCITGKGPEEYTIIGNEKYKVNDKHICQLLQSYYKKKVLIAGAGISGRAAVNLLKNFDCSTDIYTDDKEKALDLPYYNLVVISPGFKPSHPIYQVNVPKISEFELGYTIHNRSKWFAVTGSVGKTTTVSLLGKLYKYVVGNNGIPTCSLPHNILYGEPIVAEVSSAQLIMNKAFKPHICAILNIIPNHLDFHASLEEYTYVKLSIVHHQDENDYVLLPYDSLWGHDLKCKSQKIFIGGKLEIGHNCVYIEKNNVYLRLNNTMKAIFTIKKTPLQGQHNIRNILVAGTIAYLDHKSKLQIETMIETFYPLEHRLEVFRLHEGVSYINDSKATTGYSTIAALESLQDTSCILIMGGKTKGANPYDYVFEHIKNGMENVRIKILCYGESTEEALTVATKKEMSIEIYPTLRQCVDETFRILKKEEYKTVLLSPGCSSYDQFLNFEDRGLSFKRFINEFLDLN